MRLHQRLLVGAGRLVIVVTCCFCSGCMLGPRRLNTGHSGYNEAIQRTHKEEMLLNLVRLKYLELPEFVAVGSVAAQYSWDGGAGVNGNLLEAGPNVLGLNGAVGREERPTISYIPQAGAEFNRALLAPLSIETLTLLSRTGWAWDRVLRCTVQNMNGIDNATNAGGPTPKRRPEFESFRYLVQMLRVLQSQRAVELAQSERLAEREAPIQIENVDERAALDLIERGYRFKQAADGRWKVYKNEQYAALIFSPAAHASGEFQEIVRMLQLNPGRTTYEVELSKLGQIQAATEGTTLMCGPELLPPPIAWSGRGKVTLSTRSLLEIMFYLSQGIEVPLEHLQQGMVTITLDDRGQPFDWTEMTGDLLQVHASRHRPECAAVAVPYRGYWYYIDQSDVNSRSTFLFLLQLFSIETKAGGGAGLPVLTLGI